MKKTYIEPKASVLNLYTADGVAQEEETGLIGYSRRKGESPGEDEADFAKEGYHGFFDDDEDW